MFSCCVLSFQNKRRIFKLVVKASQATLLGGRHELLLSGLCQTLRRVYPNTFSFDSLRLSVDLFVSILLLIVPSFDKRKSFLLSPCYAGRRIHWKTSNPTCSKWTFRLSIETTGVICSKDFTNTLQDLAFQSVVLLSLRGAECFYQLQCYRTTSYHL